MTAEYPRMWALLQKADRFEKTASEDQGQHLAAACSQIYDAFLTKAAAYTRDFSPRGVALGAISFAADLNDTAVSTGNKVASDVADALEQLGAVAFLDETLKQASVGMPADQAASTNTLRLLGREYGVELLRGLVG